MLNLKNDLKVAQVELNCANSKVTQLQKSANDKDLIIKLLNKNQNNSSLARFPDTHDSNVAVMNKKSQGMGQNTVSNSSVRENRAKSSFGVGATKRPDTSISKNTNKELVKPTGNIKNRKSDITRSGDSSMFAGAERRAWLYVGRASSQVKEEHVMLHL
ncbi:hypothetical protein HHI36_006996 [Cryptolaemus montrouzieri]|uniref:Uncharacterized protein n=1 Tax=Cryptolaemus montrouzieri TaxID=559131 RepID=A0ABD2MN93_9CUCU